jgi:hypothetical protein
MCADTELHHRKRKTEILHNSDYYCNYIYLIGHIATRLFSRLIL